jgi:hypothetical protein
MVFKRGGKLKKQERWYMYGKRLQVVSAFAYLCIILDRRGGGRIRRGA